MTFRHTALLAVIAIAMLSPAIGWAREKPLYIKSVEILGAEAVAADVIQGLMLSKRSTLFKRRPYFPQLFEEDIRYIERFYQQKGFHRARVTDYTAQLDSTQRLARLRVVIDEGKPTVLKSLAFSGSEHLDSLTVARSIALKQGHPLDQSLMDRSVEKLLTEYARRGYLDAIVKPNVEVDSGGYTAAVTFNINEGTRFKVGEVFIQGNFKTQEKVIGRELTFKTGEWFNYSQLLRSQRNLYLSGLFKGVHIKPEAGAESDSAVRDVRIEVREELSRDYFISAGYGSVDRLRGSFEMTNRNIRGTAQKISLRVKASLVLRSVEAGFTEPWTFSTPWRTDLNSFIAAKTEPGYDHSRIGGRLTLGRSVGEYIQLSGGYRHENGRLSNVKIADPPEKLSTRVRSLEFSGSYDTRDDFFNPTRGTLALAKSEHAGAVFGVGDRFVRLVGGVKRFAPLSDHAVIGSSLELGWMDAARGLHTIPLNERFYGGGPSSVRGFGYQKLGPRDLNGNPTGGRISLTYNVVELRIQLYKIIGTALFVDAGQVWQNAEDVKLTGIRITPGASIRLSTPIGLARVGGAVNIFAGAGEAPGAVYFSIGQPF